MYGSLIKNCLVVPIRSYNNLSLVFFFFVFLFGSFVNKKKIKKKKKKKKKKKNIQLSDELKAQQDLKQILQDTYLIEKLLV